MASTTSTGRRTYFNLLPHIDLRQWIKSIDGTRSVSELTIPGTHDSATGSSQLTKDPTSWVTTQTLSVSQQLREGVRFLDIRAQLSSNVLILMHAVVELGLTLWDVVLDCQQFLKENPSECIIFALKREIEDASSVVSFEQAFYDICNKDASLWFLGNHIPIVDEVRGKLVLLRRFPLDSGTLHLGIDVRFTDNEVFEYKFNHALNQIFICEDHYRLEGKSYQDIISDKMIAIRKNISKISEHKRDRNCLFMTLLSCINSSQTPKSLADAINPLFISEYITDNIKLMGIFPCDYIRPDLVRLLVADNFDYLIPVDLRVSPSGRGLWVLLRSGRILNFGDAVGFAGARFENDIPVAFSVTPTGLGCWILSRRGRVSVNGDARSLGSPPGNAYYVDIASTSRGDGLLLLSTVGVVRVGNVKEFGGSAVGESGSVPRAIALTPSAEGCLILTQRGEIHNFGDSQHFGHFNNICFKDTLVDIKMTSSGRGFWVLGINGKIHNFGDAKSLEIVHPSETSALAFDILHSVAGSCVLTLDGCIHCCEESQAILQTCLQPSLSIGSVPAKL